MIIPELHETERFRTLIARSMGLNFDDSKLAFLADVLGRRLEATGCAPAEYLARTAGFHGDEIGVLAQELTVPETYFFRHVDQFRAFAEIALPERLRAQSAQRTLRLLSAGCASGEEAYSLAMLIREAEIDPSWHISIRAADMNPAILKKAKRARFTNWALRETTPERQHRWFRQDARDFLLDESIRHAVTFEQRNLIDDDEDLWRPGSYDVIFCRNAIMYLTAANMQTVVGHIARALAPGGYLFLGHAETLRSLTQDFHLCHTHGTFYYRRKGAGESIPAYQPATRRASVAAAVPVSAVAATDDWVGAIGRAASRIGKLAEISPEPLAIPARHNIQGALDLLLEERFEEALDLVRAFSPASARDPDTLLLHATLLTHSGQFAEAETMCRKLLAIDELNAGAHYVLALCRESAGDRVAAAEYDDSAVYLDPSFAMPRLHLGLLARRAGNLEAARRELAQALILLKREDASRLLLFGGGFTRQALTALCETALRNCGGQP
jgi:chemotaxis protein methyltransferase CheR